MGIATAIRIKFLSSTVLLLKMSQCLGYLPKNWSLGRPLFFLPQKKSKGVIKPIIKNEPWGFLWPQNFVHPDIFYLKTRLWYDPIYVTTGRGFYGGVLLSWENFLRGSWETPGSATFCGASNGIVPGMTWKGLKLKPTCCWWEISSWKMGFYHRHETKKQQNLVFLIFQTMDCVFQCKIYVENQFT